MARLRETGSVVEKERQNKMFKAVTLQRNAFSIAEENNQSFRKQSSLKEMNLESNVSSGFPMCRLLPT